MIAVYRCDCGARFKSSARRPACPECGELFGVPSSAAVVTVQATGKVWKMTMLAGGLLSVVGGVCFGLGIADGKSVGLMAAGFFAGCVGLLVYAGGRFGAWWFHG